MCDKASYEKGTSMKSLLVGIIFFNVVLMSGVANPMQEPILTLAHPSSVNDHPSDQLNTLGLAIKGKCLQAIRLALKKDNNLACQEVKPGSNLFPLEFAFYLHGSDEAFMISVLELLKNVGIEVNQYIYFSPLHYAAGHGHLRLFNQLLKERAFVDALTIDKASIVHCAAGVYPDMQGQDPAPKKQELDLSKLEMKTLLRKTSLKDIQEMERLKLNPDGNEDAALKPQRNLLNRLEILKILLVDLQTAYSHDKYQKNPQDYCIHEKLRAFLDGLTGDTETNKALYELIKSELAEICLSPRSQRLLQSPGRSSLGASS